MAGASVTLAIRVAPNAKKTEVAGRHGEAWKIRLQAPPVDGKANAALIAFLAEVLGVRENKIRIRSGEKGRDKLVEVEGITKDDADRLLG